MRAPELAVGWGRLEPLSFLIPFPFPFPSLSVYVHSPHLTQVKVAVDGWQCEMMADRAARMRSISAKALQHSGMLAARCAPFPQSKIQQWQH